MPIVTSAVVFQNTRAMKNAFKNFTIAVAVTHLPIYATTVLENSWGGSNQNIPENFGSGVSGASPGIQVSPGADGVTGTPNVALFFRPNGASGWQTYLDWDGRGDVIQHDGTFAEIDFVPSAGTKVVVVSVDLDEWSGGGGVVAEWSVVGPISGQLASGTWTGDTGGTRETINIDTTGEVGETLTLSITQTAGDLTYFAIDELTFDQIGLESGIIDFSTDRNVADGTPMELSWQVREPGKVTTLTLDDGSGPVDVLGVTDLVTGIGSTAVSPSVSKTYTLTVNGIFTSDLTVVAGLIVNFAASTGIADAPKYEVTLNWEVRPAGGTVTLFDGSGSMDVTADTNSATGIGSRVVTVSQASTTFFLDVNSVANSEVTILRGQPNTPAFSVDVSEFLTSGFVTISWSDAIAGETDWIGIYRVGDRPGVQNSTQWLYLNGTNGAGVGPSSGSVQFSGLPEGEYFAAMFFNDGYEFAQGPVLLFGNPLPPEDPAFEVIEVARNGAQTTLVWESTAGRRYEIYASDRLDGDPMVDPSWSLVASVLSEGDDTTRYTEELGAEAPARRFYRIYKFDAE